MRKGHTPVKQCGCVYLIRCVLTGDGYVGQHNRSDPKYRWKAHRDCAFKYDTQHPLYRAMRKYGIDKFKLTVLWRGCLDELNVRESYYIKKLHTFKDDALGGGYNLTTGGGGGYTWSVESRHKVSLSNLMRWEDDSYRQRMVACGAASWNTKTTAQQEETKLLLSRHRMLRWDSLSSAQRSAIAVASNVKRLANTTPAELRKIALCREAAKTPAWRSESARRSWLHRSMKQRSDDATRGWATRRANKPAK